MLGTCLGREPTEEIERAEGAARELALMKLHATAKAERPDGCNWDVYSRAMEPSSGIGTERDWTAVYSGRRDRQL